VILAGLVLLAIGASDLVRAFVRTRRWLGFIVVAVGVAALGVLAAAPLALVLALVAAGLWVVFMPHTGGGRAGAWPVLGLLVVCCAGVLGFGGGGGGLLAEFGPVASPVGELSAATIVLLAGTSVFLLESGNVIVRSALALERIVVPPAADDLAAPSAPGIPPVPPLPPRPPAARASALKGGRLIGPLERLLVFALTLSGAYTLLAAVIAAKGIVRFPEISRDGENGDRAEYFLVGSMVSWVTALVAAFLVWWAVGSLGR